MSVGQPLSNLQIFNGRIFAVSVDTGHLYEINSDLSVTDRDEMIVNSSGFDNLSLYQNTVRNIFINDGYFGELAQKFISEDDSVVAIHASSPNLLGGSKITYSIIENGTLTELTTDIVCGD